MRSALLVLVRQKNIRQNLVGHKHRLFLHIFSGRNVEFLKGDGSSTTGAYSPAVASKAGQNRAVSDGWTM